tara:strand:+ start:78 stop:704 length:627 start_codon:yes stop_codon:yes gene_type:complete
MHSNFLNTNINLLQSSSNPGHELRQIEQTLVHILSSPSNPNPNTSSINSTNNNITELTTLGQQLYMENEKNMYQQTPPNSKQNQNSNATEMTDDNSDNDSQISKSHVLVNLVAVRLIFVEHFHQTTASSIPTLTLSPPKPLRLNELKLIFEGFTNGARLLLRKEKLLSFSYLSVANEAIKDIIVNHSNFVTSMTSDIYVSMALLCEGE